MKKGKKSYATRKYGNTNCVYCGAEFEKLSTNHVTCAVCKEHLYSLRNQVAIDTRRYKRHKTYENVARKPIPDDWSNPLKIDITGLRADTWVVIGEGSKVKGKKREYPFWECKCDCGLVKEFASYKIRMSETLFCPNCNPSSYHCYYPDMDKKERKSYGNKLLILKKYNLNEDQYRGYLDKQKGCCAICSESLDRIKIDHNHSTGVVRGLLCNGCNAGLGYFKDTPINLEQAIVYLKERGYYG